MSELINNNCFFSIQSNPTIVFTDAPICQMRLTVDKIRGVLEIMTITVHQPISMNPFISITTDTTFLSPGLLFVLNMLLSESSFEASIPSYRQAQCPQRQPQYRCPQPQYNNPRPNTHYSRPNTERPKPAPKAAPNSDQAPKATSTSSYSAAEYAFLGKNPRSSDAEILGVPANASKEQIKKAYSKLALAFHPDKNKAPLAKGAFQIIRSAYERLLAKAPSAPEKAEEKPRAPKAQPKPSEDNRWDFLPENRRPSAPPAPQPSAADVAPSAPLLSSLPQNKGPAAPGW